MLRDDGVAVGASAAVGHGKENSLRMRMVVFMQGVS